MKQADLLEVVTRVEIQPDPQFGGYRLVAICRAFIQILANGIASRQEARVLANAEAHRMGDNVMIVNRAS